MKKEAKTKKRAKTEEENAPSDTSKFVSPAPTPKEKNFYPKHNPQNVR